MSAGMAGVIETHKEIENLDGYTWGCSCEWRAGLNDDHPAHVAEELAKAGYGDVQEALLAAADEMEQERSTWCLDNSGRHWIGRTLSELRQRAHALDPEGRTLVQAIHDRKAESNGN